MTAIELKDIKKIYFIGIGGIGMSALARSFLLRGVEVHGYDRTRTELTTTLESEGMHVHYTDDISFIPQSVDLVVFTPAVPKDHMELQWFRANGYEVLKRSQVLGIISRGMKTIAVAGTHGKTTTSSLVTHVLRTHGIDCTAFLGGISQSLGSNFVEGKSEWVVVEADEYDRSFLQLNPDISVIMSIDPDHLDIYGDEKTMQQAYTDFAHRSKDGGTVIVRKGIPMQIADTDKDRITLKTLGNETDKADYAYTNTSVKEGYFHFGFQTQNIAFPQMSFSMAGLHNIENATAAIAVLLEIVGKENVDKNLVAKALSTFGGIKRRFEFIHRGEKTVYIDDYAHHPTELKSAISAARMLYPTRHLAGIFQPHLFSRTRDFQQGFAEALSLLDTIILMDIYPARELPMEGVTSDIIFDKITGNRKLKATKANLLEIVKNEPIDVLLTLGAGDIDTFVMPIKEWLEQE